MLSAFFKFEDTYHNIDVRINYPIDRKYFTDGEDITFDIIKTSTKNIWNDISAIDVTLKGKIEYTGLKASHNFQFLSLTRNLSDFEKKNDGTLFCCFKRPELLYDSYNGVNVNIKYYIDLTISNKNSLQTTKSQTIAVRKLCSKVFNPEIIIFDIGIQDCLHLDFRLDQNIFNLNECISGTIKFNTLKMKINHVIIEILQVESVGGIVSNFNLFPLDSQTPNTTESGITENKKILEFEIINWTPAKSKLIFKLERKFLDSLIPFRIPLKNYPIQQTLINALNYFSIRHYLFVVLIDEEKRRYFKKHEVAFFYNDTVDE